jgi:hypothetical protein
MKRDDKLNGGSYRGGRKSCGDLWCDSGNRCPDYVNKKFTREEQSAYERLFRKSIWRLQSRKQRRIDRQILRQTVLETVE